MTGMQRCLILAVMNINMNNISIIGCGWLGLALGDFLVKKGFSVKGSTTSKEKVPLLRAKKIVPFIIKANPALEGEGLEDFFRTDVLIINVPPRRQRENIAQIHFEEIKNIIDRAGQVSKIIFCSSTGVYPDNGKIAKETDLPDPKTASTQALVRIEQYLFEKRKPDSTILRFSGLVGGSRKAGRFLAGKKDVAKGTAPVNLVHREDCILVIYEVIQQKAWGDIFNVCADKHPSRESFYTRQAALQGFEPPTFRKEKTTAFKIVSNQKLKDRLGYNFIYPDPDGFT